jgi:hypothetical protein
MYTVSNDWKSGQFYNGQKKDKKRSTKHTHKTKDRVTLTH